MQAQPVSRIVIGPETPYAVFTVAGVTYSFSAPTVTLTPLTAEELAILEIDPDSLVAGDVRFVAEQGWVDFAPTPDRVRDPASIVEFTYRVFGAMGAPGADFAARTGWLPLSFAAPNNTVVRKPRVRKARRKPVLCGV